MIVVFDGQCLLCDSWVKFLLRHDRHQRLRFASIQGTQGLALLQRAGLQAEGLQTLLLSLMGTVVGSIRRLSCASSMC